MRRVLVVIEPGLDPTPLLTLARGVSERSAVLVLGAPGESLTVALQVDARWGVAVEGLEVAEYAADVIARVAKENSISLVVLPATARFREIFPLLAYRLGASSVADVTALAEHEGELRAERLLYGGVARASVALTAPTALLTASTTRCQPDAGVPVEPLAPEAAVTVAKRLVSREPLNKEASLTGAQRIVSFGRGLRSADDVAMIERLATLLAAQVGCSRPIVEDARWLGVEHQVGLTGTTVTPELYLAIGISGQIQHLVGMRESKAIVAINNNPAAPIFTVADLGIVADLYDIVPRLVDALAAKSG
ncbi:MAG TPA: electron transfer flavoprotein subunit alpha/FixB family protein [Acidimicrobiales bacterium]|nr:electron transfer flavoprotein subunit alpha/FixB family protein [Acidimicrobiales bacterium]